MTPEEYRDQHPEYAENEKEHDCNKCEFHRRDRNNGLCYCGCGSAKCEYELRTPTLEEAVKIFGNTSTDYGDATEDEIEEIDKAIDVIFSHLRKYLKDNTAEWKDFIDGATGRKTDRGICSKCAVSNSWKSPYCPNCGRMMKGGAL